MVIDCGIADRGLSIGGGCGRPDRGLSVSGACGRADRGLLAGGEGGIVDRALLNGGDRRFLSNPGISRPGFNRSIGIEPSSEIAPGRGRRGGGLTRGSRVSLPRPAGAAMNPSCSRQTSMARAIVLFHGRFALPPPSPPPGGPISWPAKHAP